MPWEALEEQEELHGGGLEQVIAGGVQIGAGRGGRCHEVVEHVPSAEGLVKLGHSREEKLKKVALAVDREDVTFSLKEIRFFRHCLE